MLIIAYGLLTVSVILMALFLAAIADARRADDLHDDWSDRLERGDGFVIPADFHSTGDTQ